MQGIIQKSPHIEDRFGRDGIESVVIKNFGLASGRESFVLVTMQLASRGLRTEMTCQIIESAFEHESSIPFCQRTMNPTRAFLCGTALL